MFCPNLPTSPPFGHIAPTVPPPPQPQKVAVSRLLLESQHYRLLPVENWAFAGTEVKTFDEGLGFGPSADGMPNWPTIKLRSATGCQDFREFYRSRGITIGEPYAPGCASPSNPPSWCHCKLPANWRVYHYEHWSTNSGSEAVLYYDAEEDLQFFLEWCKGAALLMTIGFKLPHPRFR